MVIESGGVRGFVLGFIHHDFYRREQANFVTRFLKHLVQQRRNRRFAIGSRYAHQLQILRWVSVEICRQKRQRGIGIFYLNVSDTACDSLGESIANDGHCAHLDRLLYIVVPSETLPRMATKTSLATILRESKSSALMQMSVGPFTASMATLYNMSFKTIMIILV
jgi:hypothetical protein